MKAFLDKTKYGAITVWLDGEGQYTASVHDDQRRGKATANTPEAAILGAIADFNAGIDAEILELEAKISALKEERERVNHERVTEPGKVSTEARKAE